jgi:hypothetical protein
MDAEHLIVVYREGIRSEFEHNLSQQIYVPEEIWQAIQDLKEQQLFIIEQLSAALPKGSPGIMLEAAILHFQESDPNASLQPLVLDALRNAARKQLSGQ